MNYVLCKLCGGAGSLLCFGQPGRKSVAYFTCPSCAGHGCIDGNANPGDQDHG